MPAKSRPMRLRHLLAANLRAERGRSGLTQEELAEKAKVHATYVSRVETARYNVGIDNVERFAEALGVEPETLLLAPSRRLVR